MLNFIKGLFGMDAVVNSATKIIDKIAGTDWTAKEKADWVLQYQQGTKHQSPARRFIAISVTLIWFFVMIGMIAGYLVGDFLEIPRALIFANDMKMVIKDQISEPFNYVIMFYFAMGAINSIKK
tara:strand:+ start:2857 stop:3228 length:372 start_codon:yes stop_codon:yes gene_type:complete